jgi:diguanylate cyclase (GGDEF)-like protein/PAS domain S-box-containing protein
MSPVEAAMRRRFARQVARARGADGTIDIDALRALICRSYVKAEQGRRRGARAMGLMAEELQQANRKLSRLVEDLGVQGLRFEAALENMPFGLIMYDAEERVVVVNRRLCEVAGVPQESIRPGMTLREVLAVRVAHGHLPAIERDVLLAERRALLYFSEPREIEERVGDRTLLVSSRPMAGRGCVILVQDITERRAAEAHIAHLARHDALTGLPNRAQFHARLKESLALAQRGQSFALLCLDLDHFKQVNDTLGHPIGDQLLREVTARLRRTMRESDMIARLGGDEFAIIQGAIQRPEDATVLAERLISVLSEPCEIEGHRIAIGTCIGITRGPADGGSADELLKNADLALYRAKAEGRGTWRCFEPEMDARMQERRRLEMDLRAALEAEEFQLLYQPLVDTARMSLNGFEALLRWHSPSRGTVSPAEFIPLAEETGLIVPLGAWVVRAACQEATTWPARLSIAVNVSVVQFRQPGFVDIVAAALRDSGLDPARLELEVTETIMLEDNAQTLAQLHRLRRLGVRISMDDFGTGYSSLSYLRSFPFDKIKIDQSFIRDLDQRSEAQAIVRAIAGLGQSLGMRTTAEGVENAAQLRHLRTAGCTDAQGYLFGRPIPADRLTDFFGQCRAEGLDEVVALAG